MRVNLLVVAAIYMGSVATFHVPADAPDGLHLHLRDEEGNITVRHATEIPDELMQRAAKPVPNLLSKPKPRRSRIMARADSQFLEQPEQILDTPSLYEALWGLGEWLGSGRRLFRSDYEVNPNSCVDSVAATWKAGDVMAYICTYTDAQNIDANFWVDYTWPLISSPNLQDQNDPDTIKAAFYEQSQWKAAFGFTKVGTNFCSDRPHFCITVGQ